jgi:hypothetical protein
MTQDGTQMSQADEKLMVRFYLSEELNEPRSREAGMNKYDDIEMVEILIPGCRDNCIRKASDQDKQRFARQYASFLNTKGTGHEGTPLSQFPFISPGERKELEYFNIYTGEGLVSLSDGYLEKVPLDLRPMIQKVKAFMEYAKDSSVVVKHAAENNELRQEIDLLKSQLKQLMGSLERGNSNGDTAIDSGKSDEKSSNEVRKRRGRKAQVQDFHEQIAAYNA